MKKAGIVIAGLVVCMVAVGCGVLEPKAVPPSGHFYLDKTADFSTVGRVVVAELESDNASPALGKTLTQSLVDGVDKKHLFNVFPIYRLDSEWIGLNLDDLKSFTPQDIANVRKLLKADALIYGTITRYRSYPQLLIAMNLKMIDLRDGRLLWALEDVWDSTDKNIELRIKDFYKHEMRTGYEPMNWQIVLTSPNAFYKYVIYEVTATLPTNQQ